MPGTLTIDAAAVRALVGNAAVVAEFPFLRGVAVKRPGCCGKGRALSLPSPTAVMRALVSLPPARREVFKRLVGASTVAGPVVRAARVRKESF